MQIFDRYPLRITAAVLPRRSTGDAQVKCPQCRGGVAPVGRTSIMGTPGAASDVRASGALHD